MKNLLSSIVISVAVPASAQDVAAMNDLEYAHIAHPANKDIRYPL